MQLSVQERFRSAKAQSQRLLRKDAAHTDWMNECVPELMSHGKDQLVAVAACLNMWRDAWEETHPDGADDPGPDRPQKAIYARAREVLARGTWNEADHPRVPAGGPDGGQFGPGGGSSKPSKPGKSKKPAKKEDFDKAKITIAGDKAHQDAFIARWNEKVGEDPAEFKKGFMGGLDGHMNIGGSGSQMEIKGQVEDEGGKVLGTFTRNIDLENKIAKSAYFELQQSARNSDIGKHLLAGNVETYQELGIEKVRVYANIDVGGYAWAKYGYVPEASAWATLSAKLERKIGGGSSTSSSGDTYEADDWNMLSSDRQDDVRDAWMRSTYSEFLSSEEQNWRESGQAKDDAKRELASMYGGGDIPEWASEAFDGAREYREERDQPPIPYTNKQLYDAITVDYESRNGDGEDDPDISFDDDKLKEPIGYDPAQGTLPGIEPIDPASYLTQDMRDRIEKRMIASFDKKAEDDAQEIDPPTYLADSIAEYQEEYWDQKDDDEKLRHAVDLGLADIEIESEDDEDDGLGLNPELFPPEEDELLKAVRSNDPKSIWKIADHPRGKELLLGTDWNGVLNLKDKESMARFNEYVGRRKHG
jgi:hypothetical protein